MELSVSYMPAGHDATLHAPAAAIPGAVARPAVPTAVPTATTLLGGPAPGKYLDIEIL